MSQFNDWKLTSKGVHLFLDSGVKNEIHHKLNIFFDVINSHVFVFSIRFEVNLRSIQRHAKADSIGMSDPSLRVGRAAVPVLKECRGF